MNDFLSTRRGILEAVLAAAEDALPNGAASSATVKHTDAARVAAVAIGRIATSVVSCLQQASVLFAPANTQGDAVLRESTHGDGTAREPADLSVMAQVTAFLSSRPLLLPGCATSFSADE